MRMLDVGLSWVGRGRLNEKLIALVVSILTFANTQATHAGVNVWTNVGLEGGAIGTLAIDPTAPSTLYAGTNGGVYKSTNGGVSWQAANNGMTIGVYALAIDPQTPSTIYAGTNGYVFKSTDGGGSWSPSSTGLTASNGSPVYVYALVIDPTAPNTVYAGLLTGGTGNGGVFKSTDGGATWNYVGVQLVFSLVIDPTSPKTLYAGTMDIALPYPGYDGRVYKSTDAGATWTMTTSALGGSVLTLAVDPLAPNTVYAGSFGAYTGTHGTGVHKSTDAGATWKTVNNGLDSLEIGAVAVDPAMPGTVYAGALNGTLYKSMDGGSNWGAINSGLTATFGHALAIDPVSPATVYAGTVGGVFKSANRGGTWSAVNSGLKAAYVQALALDTRTPRSIYVGTQDGVYTTANRGTTWSAVNNGLTNKNVLALAIDATNPNTVYAGTNGGGIFKSTDAGANWNARNDGLTNTVIRALAVDPTTPNTVYAGTAVDLFKSTDGGGSWSATGLLTPPAKPSSLDGVYAVAIDPTTPSTVYAGVWRFDATGAPIYAGIPKSTDGGASWSWDSVGQTITGVNALAIDPTTPSTVFAESSDGVIKSTDGGKSWNASWGMTGRGVIVGPGRALAIDPTMPGTVYAGFFIPPGPTFLGVGDVYRTTDGGGSWNALTNGLTNTQLNALAIDPTPPSQVYAGTWGGLFSIQQAAAFLAAALAASDTVITVDDINALPDSGVVMIDDEQIAYSGKQAASSGSSFSGTAAGQPGLLLHAQRGVHSAPTTHASGSPVFLVRAGSTCTGDCNNDREVTVDEILILVNRALGNADPTACTAADANHDGQTTVDEILAAVNDALKGCPPPPTTACIPATCGSGFVDNCDGTITDCTTKLTWEKKSADGSLHDWHFSYQWAGTCSVGGAWCQPSPEAAAACAAGTGSASTVGCAQCPSGETCNCAGGACNTNSANPAPGHGNFSTMWQWLVWLNSGGGFAGATDWRIPKLLPSTPAQGTPTAFELDSLVNTAAPGCGGGAPMPPPCTYSAFNTGCSAGCTVLTCSCTDLGYYWSATTYTPDPSKAWYVVFRYGTEFAGPKDSNNYMFSVYYAVRAVRGGS